MHLGDLETGIFQNGAGLLAALLVDTRAGDFLEETETALIGELAQLLDTALLNHVVGVVSGEAGRLQKALHLILGMRTKSKCHLCVQFVVDVEGIVRAADRATNDHLVRLNLEGTPPQSPNGKALVRVVENDVDSRSGHGFVASFLLFSDAFLFPHKTAPSCALRRSSETWGSAQTGWLFSTERLQSYL